MDEYGAIANDSSVDAAVKNSQAISTALQNATQGGKVVVPRYSKYYIFSVYAAGLKQVQFQIEGQLIAISNISAWPISNNGYQSVLYFPNCSDFTLTGSGTIDGQGYRWWVEIMFNFLQYRRPHLLLLENCVNILIENVTLLNSPEYHVYARPVKNLLVRNVYIWVDVEAQKSLLNSSPWKVPMFPFNTDGIDPAGQNILIQNITVENYDDAVAVKPSHLKEEGCTENVVVENANIINSVGMSIGSVPPDPKINCIRNVTFRNINFSHPFKAIYMKGLGLLTTLSTRISQYIHQFYGPSTLAPNNRNNQMEGEMGSGPHHNPS